MNITINATMDIKSLPTEQLIQELRTRDRVFEVPFDEKSVTQTVLIVRNKDWTEKLQTKKGK